MLQALADGEGEAAVPPALRVPLRAAALHERLRARTFAEAAGGALRALAEAGVPALVSRGVALERTAYPAPGLRHCHDLDVLVPAAAMAGAGRALAGAGLAPLDDPDRAYRHPSGLPVRLHSSLFLVPGYGPTLEEVTARSVPLDVDGTMVQAPDAADLLTHVVVHAATGAHRRGLLWACDAWHLVRASGAGLDWDGLVARAGAGGVALPLVLGLRYLADALDAPVPGPALAALDAAAGAAGRARREVALEGVRQGLPGGGRELLRRAGGPAAGLAAARALLLPSRAAREMMGPYRRTSRPIWPAASPSTPGASTPIAAR